MKLSKHKNKHKRKEADGLAAEKEEEIIKSEIIDNVIKNGTILGIQKRNWIEAIIFTAIVLFIIGFIPFVADVKAVVMIMCGGGTFFLCLKGIKSRSVTQIIIAEQNFKKNRRMLYLRSPEHERQNIFFKNEGSDSVILQQFKEKFEEKRDEFIEQNL